jgi:hypothetical protein
MFWQQGHSDQGNTAYTEDVIDYYDQVNADVKAATGQTEDVIFVMPQIGYSSDGVGNDANQVNNIDQQILDLYDQRDTRPIYVMGPVYQITNFIHAYRAGYRWIGELFGNVAAKIMFDNVDWKPVRPISFTVVDDYIDVEFDAPVSPLQFDTNDNNIDATLTNKGFEYDGAAAITGVTLEDATTVRIQLDGNVVIGDVLKYTGPANRFGNLVDSSTDTAFFKDQDWTAAFTSGSPKFAEGNLNDLRNWACAFTAVMTDGEEPASALTWDAANKSANISLSNSDRTGTNVSDGWSTARSLLPKSTGKWQVEAAPISGSGGTLGLCAETFDVANIVGFAGDSGTYEWPIYSGMFAAGTGTGFVAGSGVRVMMIDFDAGKVWYALSYGGGVINTVTGDPVAGTDPAMTFTPNTPLCVAYTAYSAGNGMTLVETPTVPLYDGFSSWNTG